MMDGNGFLIDEREAQAGPRSIVFYLMVVSYSIISGPYTIFYKNVSK